VFICGLNLWFIRVNSCPLVVKHPSQEKCKYRTFSVPGTKIIPALHLNSPLIESATTTTTRESMTNTRRKKLNPATREACERISQGLQERRANGARANTLARQRAAPIRQLPTYSQIRNR
jgi:hypothetical protein